MNKLKEFFEKEREGWRVRNIEKLDIKSKEFNVFTIVCPLFKPGLLSKSELVDNPNSLQDSRIFSKWIEFKKITKRLQKECNEIGMELVVNIIFADKAVPLKDKRDIKNILKNDLQIWKKETSKLGKEIGCRVNPVITASEIIPSAPNILRIGSFSHIKSERDIIISVSDVLEEWFGFKLINPEDILREKQRMDVVKKMRKFFGFDITSILLLNYISLDWKMVNTFNMDMVVSIERFGLLHTLSKLTKEMDDVPRLEITV